MSIPKEKLCNRCKQTKSSNNFYRRRSGNDLSPYCKPCTLEQTLERQRNFKLKCVEYLGNSCVCCNYSKCTAALEFHHLDASKKDFTISRAKLTSFTERITNELDKCILLCSNCHREIHSGLRVCPDSNGESQD